MIPVDSLELCPFCSDVPQTHMAPSGQVVWCERCFPQDAILVEIWNKRPGRDRLASEISYLAAYILELDCGHPVEGESAIDAAVAYISELQGALGEVVSHCKRWCNSPALRAEVRDADASVRAEAGHVILLALHHHLGIDLDTLKVKS